MTSNGRRAPKVALALKLSLASGRDLLTGITRYAKADRRWDIRLLPIPELYTAEVIRALAKDGTEGLITSEIVPKDIGDALADSKIPLAVVGIPEGPLAARTHAVAYIRNDDVGVGRAGARFLMSRGNFNSYGLVTAENPKSYCAAARETGFAGELTAHGRRSETFAVQAEAGRDLVLPELGEWLRSLPKPAAVMAYSDCLANEVLEAAKYVKIRVPGQLALIGVDNDELICDLSTPGLTSISPDHVTEGELAARALDALMRRRPPIPAAKLVNHGCSVVERDSVHTLSPGTHLAKCAAVFIETNYAGPIGVPDVVAHLRVSRRLADLRYREFTGESIYGTIMRLRLAKAKRLLAETHLSVSRVTASCGFPNANYARKAFKARFRTTMRDYRRDAT